MNLGSRGSFVAVLGIVCAVVLIVELSLVLL
jgi:hypothetical protein